MLRWIYIILLSIGIVLSLGSLLQAGYSLFQQLEIPQHHPRDTYDPQLSRLNNIEKLESFVDSLAFEKGLTTDSIPAYINLADSVLRMRFYYGLQNYPFADNFIANTLGKYLWSHLGAKVIPDDILKGQKAYCSQSSIVFQEFLKHKGYDVRTVLLPGHFCTEVLVNGNWQFHDVSFKPALPRHKSMSANDLLSNPQYLEEAYLYTFAESFRDDLHQQFHYEKISYGEINAFAAPHMALFHRISYFLSLWGWFLFLTIGLVWRIVFL